MKDNNRNPYKKSNIISKIKKTIPIVTFLISVIIFAGIIELVSAEKSSVGDTITPPVKNTDYELGTEHNPLFILEIVPNKSYSEIGYLISGCEPVDMEKLSIDSMAYSYGSRRLADCKTVTETKYEFEMDLSEPAFSEGKWYMAGDQRGYYQKVTDGTGTIVQEKMSDDSYTYTFVGEGLGQYIWVAENNWNNQTDHNADKVWLNVKKYARNKMVFTHYNAFLKDAIRVPLSDISDYQTVVITVDPADLRNTNNLELIELADFIYINGKSHDQSLVQIWNKFNNEGLELTNPATDFTGDNDLTWDAIMAIFNRMVSNNRTSIIMNLPSVYKIDSDNNVHKLSIMLLQMGPATFNKLFMETGKIQTTTVNGRETGYYVGKDGNQVITQWSQSTFPDNDKGTMYGDVEFKNPNITASNITAGEGIYTYNDDMSLLENLCQNNVSDIPVTKEAFDFYEYYDKYLKEDADPDSERRTSLSPAEVIYFIHNQSLNLADKSEINILEIQPFHEFLELEEWKKKYKEFFPSFTGDISNIHVTTMTTYEYIGNIEDINSKYDMIYFGLFPEDKNVVNYYDTYYNSYLDSDLNGKIYLSIGDKVNADSSVRYSGNDITKLKLEQLKKFMESGKPIMLASGFYEDSTRSKVSTAVDKATYMYDLVDVVMEKGVTVNTDNGQAAYRSQFKDSIFCEDNFNSYILWRKITDDSCSMEFADMGDPSKYPVPYSYTTKSDGSIDTPQYNKSNTLKYRFRIKGTADAYTVKLFIDNNGDGKYNGSLDTQTSAKAESLNNLTIKNDANVTVNMNSLKPNTWYTLTRSLDSSYQGIIPWKLEVNAVSNSTIRASEINYTLIKQTSEANKVQINVLQVAIDSGTGNQATTFNMETNETFQTYLKSVDEYKINITYMSNSEFLSLYHNCSGAAEAGKYDYLGEYDMLFLGFRDTCSYTNNEYANQNILDFISQGKSVIFSHDMIWDKDANGYRLYNDMLRKLLHQDRYDFTTGSTANEEAIYYDDTTDKLITNSIRVYDYWANLLFGKDKYWKFYTDNSNKLYWLFGKNTADRNDTTVNKNWGELSFMETDKISIANRGQITQYPFTIGDYISVSTTHTQYYQLDLEQEGLVVWYNLTDSKSELNDGKNDGFYSSRENDARNNYYIYSKGNITYTGLGHTNNLTEDEIKLFINTMVSAYRAGTAKPKIILTNEEVYDGDEEQYLFINADGEISTTSDTDQVSRVTFRVEDESIVNTSDREYYVNYYGIIPDPADSNKIIRVSLNSKADITSSDVLTTRNLDTGETCSLVSGKGTRLNGENEFAIDVPLKYFNGNNNLLIEFELEFSEVNEDNITIDQNSITKLYLITKPFFDLD